MTKPRDAGLEVSVRSARTGRHQPGRWLALAGGLFGGAMFLAFGVGIQAWRSRSMPGTEPRSAANEIAAGASAVPSPPLQDDGQALDQIRRGDPEAMSALESRPRHLRTAEENLALAEGRSVRKKIALSVVRGELVSHQTPEQRRIVMGRLGPFIADGEAAKTSVAILAQVPGPEGPDALYEIWTRTPQRTELTSLARDLVFSADVRPRASESLAATLELRRAETCGQIRDALPAVWAHGDRRALTTLARIARMYSCQRGRSEECHPCLRGTVSLHDAIEAVRVRPAPARFW